MAANDTRLEKGFKCYNSVSCISVVIIIIFILGSILFDMLVTKPDIRKSINDIKTEIQSINHRLDSNITQQAPNLTETVEFSADSALHK